MAAIRSQLTDQRTQRAPYLLLVDDDDGDAKAVKRAFAKANIANQILRASDGIEALEILRGENGHTPPDGPLIMLIDINMPRMNGIELVQALRDDPKLKQTLAFMLSTSKSQEDKSAAYQHNIAGYIVKETAGRDFLKLVDMLERYWQIIELPQQ